MLHYFEKTNARLNRRIFPQGSEYQQMYRAAIDHRLRLAKVALDLGAGSHDRRLLWKKLEATPQTQAVLIGCDVDAERLVRNPMPLKLAADARALPLADASVDLIVGNCTFEHLQNPREILAECQRALRPRVP